jgi:hypothetical protein
MTTLPYRFAGLSKVGHKNVAHQLLSRLDLSFLLIPFEPWEPSNVTLIRVFSTLYSFFHRLF